MMYRVYYPIAHRDAFADFDARWQADLFAAMLRGWNHAALVSVVEILVQDPEAF